MNLKRVTLDLQRIYIEIYRFRVEDEDPHIVFGQNNLVWWEHLMPPFPIFLLKYSPADHDEEKVFAFSTDSSAFRKWPRRRRIVRFDVEPRSYKASLEVRSARAYAELHNKL
jgi:hypothetical protein